MGGGLDRPIARGPLLWRCRAKVCRASLRLCRYGLFWNKASFNDDISDWNVASVSTMFRLFQAQASFNQNVGGWNVASVTDLTNTFNVASSFDHDISRCVEPQRLNSVGRGKD
jgi:hypothetical protein